MIEISFDTKELEKQLRAYANAYGKAYVSKAVELMRNEAQKCIETRHNDDKREYLCLQPPKQNAFKT